MTRTTPSNAGTQAPAVQGCIEACRRCEAMVRAIAPTGSVDDRSRYAKIGRHMRHCIDHFTCLLDSLETGVVDYDARDREERLEQDPRYFLDNLTKVMGRLESIDPATATRNIDVKQEAASEGGRVSVSSNVERELVFLSGHTIHHIAIMTLLARAEGLQLPDDLGMAFSTATHLRKG